MPLEKGGRADKMGNRYEIRCIIYEMLKILRENQIIRKRWQTIELEKAVDNIRKRQQS